MMCFGRAMRVFVLLPPPSVPLPSSPPLQNKNHHCTGKTHSLQKTTAIRISSPFSIFSIAFVKILLENEQFLTNLTPGPGSVIFQTDPDPRKNNGSDGSRIRIRNTDC